MQEKPEKYWVQKISVILKKFYSSWSRKEAERFELYKVKEFSKEKREDEMFELEKEKLKAQTKNWKH